MLLHLLSKKHSAIYIVVHTTMQIKSTIYFKIHNRDTTSINSSIHKNKSNSIAYALILILNRTLHELYSLRITSILPSVITVNLMEQIFLQNCHRYILQSLHNGFV